MRKVYPITSSLITRMGERLKCVSCGRKLEEGDLVVANVKVCPRRYRCLPCAVKYNLINTKDRAQRILANGIC